jgi:DNA-binding transcriptional LysR family regulator
MFDWNDARVFLAVADGGSTLKAARALRVSQTTAARRIGALEEALGVPLFERRPAGYALTDAGRALLPMAEAVGRAADALAAAAAAERRDVRGVVRVSTANIFGTTVMPAILRDLHDAHPAIRIELDTHDDVRDLGAGEADVALRACKQPEGAGLVARRIGDDIWNTYCSRDYAARHGAPTRRAELPGHAIVGGGEPGVWRYYREWLARNGLDGAVAMHYDSSVGLLSAVRAGMGLAALPSFIAEQDPDLVRCLRGEPSGRGIWLLTHERVRHAPRVRAVMQFLGDRLARLARAAGQGVATSASNAA